MMGTEVVARNYIQSVAKTTSQTKLFALITIRLRFRSSRRVSSSREIFDLSALQGTGHPKVNKSKV